MKRAVDLLVPVVATSGREWHRVKQSAVIEIPDGGHVELELAAAIEVAGQVRTSTVTIPASRLVGRRQFVLPPVTLDPGGHAADPAIRDQDGLVDGHPVTVESEVFVLADEPQ